MDDVVCPPDAGQEPGSVPERRERFRFTVDTSDPAAVRKMASEARVVGREIRLFVSDALAKRGRRRHARRYLREVLYTRLRKLEAYLDALGREPSEGAP